VLYGTRTARFHSALRLPAWRTHSLPPSGQCSDDYSGIVVDDNDDDGDDNDGWNPTASVVVGEFEFDFGVALFGSSRPLLWATNQSITHPRLNSTQLDPTRPDTIPLAVQIGLDGFLHVVSVVPEHGDAHILICTRDVLHLGNRCPLQCLSRRGSLEDPLALAFLLSFQDGVFWYDTTRHDMT